MDGRGGEVDLSRVEAGVLRGWRGHDKRPGTLLLLLLHTTKLARHLVKRHMTRRVVIHRRKERVHRLSRRRHAEKRQRAIELSRLDGTAARCQPTRETKGALSRRGQELAGSSHRRCHHVCVEAAHLPSSSHSTHRSLTRVHEAARASRKRSIRDAPPSSSISPSPTAGAISMRTTRE